MYDQLILIVSFLILRNIGFLIKKKTELLRNAKIIIPTQSNTNNKYYWQ